MLAPQLKGLTITPSFIGKILALLSLGIVAVAYQSVSTCACGPPESFGRGAIFFLSWHQIYHYLDHQTFAQSLKELQIPPEDFDFNSKNFVITLQGTTDKTSIRAIPKSASIPNDVFKLGLRKYYLSSMIGTVSIENGKFYQILCFSEEPTTTVAPDTSFKNGQLSCPVNFRRIGEIQIYDLSRLVEVLSEKSD